MRDEFAYTFWSLICANYSDADLDELDDLVADLELRAGPFA